MEKQKMNVATLVIVIAIVLIVGVIVGVFIGKNTSQVQIGRENKVVETDLQTSKDYEGSKQEERLTIPSLFTSNAKKVKDEKYILKVSDYSNIFQLTIEDGVPKIRTIKTPDEIEGYGLDVTKIKINNTMQKINGFTKKVVDACIISDEHQIAACTFIFLMEDGTVEYSTLQSMIDNISTQGKIEGLSNIIRLQKVNIASQNPDNTAIVIDNNNDYYDVLKYINEGDLSSKEEVNRKLEDLAWVLRDIECEIGQLPSNENILANLENKYYLAWSAMNHDTNERSKFQGINANGEAETGARAVKTEEFIKYYQKIYQEDLDIEQLLKTKVGNKLTVKNGMMYSHIITGYSQDVFKIEVEDIKLNEKNNVYTLSANYLRNTNNENKKIEIQYQKDTNSQTNILKSISFIQ